MTLNVKALFGLALVLGSLLAGQPVLAGGPCDEVKKLRAELATARRNKAFLETRLEMCKSNVKYYQDACDKDIQDNKVVSPTLLAALLRWQDRLSDTEFQLQDTRDRITDLEQQLRDAEARSRTPGRGNFSPVSTENGSSPTTAMDEAQGGPVQRGTLVAQGSGPTKAAAEADAHTFARFAIPSGARSYRVLSRSFRQVGDLWECSMSVEYFLPR